MRFQDWDVLLFPSGSSVPIREFRTACFAYQDGLITTPLLTSFVPSLDTGAAFQISVHSWTKPTSILGPNAGYAPGISYVWRVKIAIDGQTVVADTSDESVAWPRQIGTPHAIYDDPSNADDYQIPHQRSAQQKSSPSRSFIAPFSPRACGTRQSRRDAFKCRSPLAPWCTSMANYSS